LLTLSDKMKKAEAIATSEALLEMYKAGFLDGYKKHAKLKTKKDWADLNKAYKTAFNKRFGKAITKHLKKK
jgi:hypothetical protein